MQDDIKDSVRRAALSLARTVRGLTLRLADPQHTGQQGEEGERAAGRVLRCAGLCRTAVFAMGTSRTATLRCAPLQARWRLSVTPGVPVRLDSTKPVLRILRVR